MSQIKFVSTILFAFLVQFSTSAFQDNSNKAIKNCDVCKNKDGCICSSGGFEKDCNYDDHCFRGRTVPGLPTLYCMSKVTGQGYFIGFFNQCANTIPTRDLQVKRQNQDLFLINQTIVEKILI